MKIYDENWNELTDPDLQLGRLEPARRLVAHHDAVPGVPAAYGWQVLPGTENLRPGGLRRQVEILPAVPARGPWDEYEECQLYRPYTAEELAAMNAPTDAERLEAQVLYTAMMTDTLLEEVTGDV